VSGAASANSIALTPVRFFGQRDAGWSRAGKKFLAERAGRESQPIGNELVDKLH
jgi:hypothetical protein